MEQPVPTVKTTILVLANTSGSRPDLSAFKADVVFYCGGLTAQSEFEEYVEATTLLTDTKAPLVIAIPGYTDSLIHDEELHVLAMSTSEPRRFLDDLNKWKDPRQAPRRIPIITHVEDTVQSVRLPNGAYLRYFAGPYTRPPHADRRFLIGEECDIAVTYSAPYGILDRDEKGRHWGSPELLGSIARFKPKVHCFGQVPSSWGTAVGRWKDGFATHDGELDIKKAYIKPGDEGTPLTVVPADMMSWRFLRDGPADGERTVFVNASIYRHPRHAPTPSCSQIEMDLPARQPPSWRCAATEYPYIPKSEEVTHSDPPGARNA